MRKKRTQKATPEIHFRTFVRLSDLLTREEKKLWDKAFWQKDFPFKYSGLDYGLITQSRLKEWIRSQDSSERWLSLFTIIEALDDDVFIYLDV